MIKTADWIVDLGPEGGGGGGRILVAGTPETVAETAGSHTGRFLAPHLGIAPAKAQKDNATKNGATKNGAPKNGTQKNGTQKSSTQNGRDKTARKKTA